VRLKNIALGVLFAGLQAQAAAVVAPAGNGGIEGGGSFGGIIYDLQQTAQMLIPVAYLGGLNSGDQLTGLQFRLNAGEAAGPPAAFIYSNFDITVSQPSATVSNASNASFADNIGPDAVLVRSGAFTIAANSFPTGGSPNAFGPMIDFTTPYSYTGGDLLITMRMLTTTGTATNLILDAEFIVSGFTLSGAPYNGTNSTSAASYIPVMQLQVGRGVSVDDPPVGTPEPCTFALALAGFALVALKRRK
jgi:hypothetical protein